MGSSSLVFSSILGGIIFTFICDIFESEDDTIKTYVIICVLAALLKLFFSDAVVLAIMMACIVGAGIKIHKQFLS